LPENAIRKARAARRSHASLRGIPADPLRPFRMLACRAPEPALLAPVHLRSELIRATHVLRGSVVEHQGQKPGLVPSFPKTFSRLSCTRPLAFQRSARETTAIRMKLCPQRLHLIWVDREGGPRATRPQSVSDFRSPPA
jgi:hypothetical protein